MRSMSAASVYSHRPEGGLGSFELRRMLRALLEEMLSESAIWATVVALGVVGALRDLCGS